MKNEKEMPQASKGKKTGSNSNPENKFKKGQSTTAAEIDNIIKGSVENVKPQSGEGYSDKGTVSIYGDES